MGYMTRNYINELVDAGYTVEEYKDVLHDCFKYGVSMDDVRIEEAMMMYRVHDDEYTYRVLRKLVNAVDNELSKKAKLAINSVYGSRIYNYDIRSMYPKNMIVGMGRHQGKTELMNQAHGFRLFMDAIIETKKKEKEMNKMKIKNVIFNDPATIVFWADGSKTVVKCQPGDVFDPEKGLAMAITKKAFGNQGNYCNVFKKWIPEK